ncbi:hypothetical protein B0T22DRAFT_197686 [Podospora appendiculata]|uniref:DUF676 domain-containing protein n=1 Tax=Podospora appendiculata TaxID=314037 RepID=A0AAE0X430_9PEZI|nr:hypothetical protein B0T22DRAFT_197686 [Podospora appendiculata]
MGTTSNASPSPRSGRSEASLHVLHASDAEDSTDGAYHSSSPGLYSSGSGGMADYPHWRSVDPRSSSTQSLAPSRSGDEQRRTLLFIYIHGFMGNDSSFRSFPAHVHSFLKEALAKTHTIHTKIYPRYKTYKAIDVARDNLSKWLEPHESPSTDVVLVGHSMGGLLAAEVALLPSRNPTQGSPFRHHILGTISLDAPLLGLHPGIVVSGITSLFRAAPPPPGATNSTADPSMSSSQSSAALTPYSSVYSEVAPSTGLSPMFAPTQSPSPSNPHFAAPPAPDPYFNPPFFNDASFVDRGWFKNVVHFATKHKAENLFEATANHLMSHLEFGGCLADYPALKSRYKRLRKLEDVDDLNPPGGEKLARIRFVNYYTASTGIPKKPKPPKSNRNTLAAPSPDSHTLDIRSRGSNSNLQASVSRTPHDSHSDSGRPDDALDELDPVPEPWDDEPPTYTENSTPPLRTASDPDLRLPPIPDLPNAPSTPDLDSYTDKDARKLAEKEAKQARKTYDQAVKNREKAIKERQKLLEKRRRKSLKDAEKQSKKDQKRVQKEGHELQKELDALRLDADQQQNHAGESPSSSPQAQQAPQQEKKPKLRKFCMLPGKTNGVRDPAWVQVYMEGVDEVGAHCGLFFPGPHYEKLVGDVGVRVVGWVEEDTSRRAVSYFDLD